LHAILIIAHKELAVVLRDGRFHVLAGVMAAMLLVALGSAAQRYVSIASERAVAQQLVGEQWLEQDEKNPHAAAHFGLYAFRPVGPLSFFDPGVSAYQGVSIWLGAHQRSFADAAPAADSGGFGGFDELHGGFVLQVLLPLLAILVCYAGFAAEREQGTLRQLLASGAQPLHLLIGKALGALGVIALLLVPIALLGLIAVSLSGAAAATVPRVLILAVACVIYAAIFVMLSLAVSARAATQQAALVVLVGFWVVASFVIPRVAAEAAATLRPLPTLAEFRAAVEADLQVAADGRSLEELITQRRAQVLALYGAASEQELPINLHGMVLALQEELSDRAYERQFGALQRDLQAQQAVHELASLFSPRMALQRLAAELAETSPDAQAAFESQAESYRREFVALLNRDLTFNSAGGQTDYRAGPELWAQVEPWHFHGRDAGRVAASLAPGAMLLLLWLLLATALAVMAARSPLLATAR
jgi:ABC-2 type transport system permease protein